MQYVAIFHHKFEITDAKQYINRCCYGGDILVSLIEPHLRENNFKIGKSGQEDWGWFIWFDKQKCGYSIDIGLEDEELWKYKIFVIEKTSFWKRLFSKSSESNLDEICSLVDSALKSYGIKNISWFKADEQGTEVEEVAIKNSEEQNGGRTF
jgi:hypothetical protein